MKIYISGKITGCENWEENFNAVEWHFRAEGAVFYNPVELGREVEARVETPKYSDYMRRDIAKLLECDRVLLLPNWRTSRGARLEVAVAEACGIQVEKISRKTFGFIIGEYRKKAAQR